MSVGEPWSRQLLRFAVATAAYTLTAWATLSLARASGGIALIWISNALILGFALRRPLAALPGLLAAVVMGVALASVLTAAPFGFGLVAGLINAIEVALAYAVIHRSGLRPPMPISEGRLLLFFVGVVLVAPAVTAALGATLANARTGEPWSELFRNWALADAIGMFLLLPLMWSYSRERLRKLARGPGAPLFWSMAALTVVVALLALAYLPRPTTVMMLPLLVLAVHARVLGTAIGNLLLVATVLAATQLEQRGVMHFRALGPGALPLAEAWLYACIGAVGPLLVAFVASQRDAQRRQAIKLGERLRVITDSLPAYIAEVGPDRRYRFVNAYYEQQLGLPRERIVGRRLGDILGGDLAARLAPRLERVLAGEAQRFELTLPGDRIMDVCYEPLPGSGGFVLLGNDVTWRHEAERRFRMLLESAPDAMAVVDRETRCVVLVNAQAERTFGYSRDEMIGQPIDHLLMHAERMDRAVVEAHLAAKAAGRSGEVLELVGLRRDGSVFPMEVVLSALQGEGSQLVAAMRDVSARRRAERDLHLERERAQVTLESIGDAVITYDTAWRITSLNPVAEALTGWTRDEALGRPYSEVVRLRDPATGSALAADGTPAGDAGDEVELSAVLLRRDGAEVYVDDSDSPIRDNEGTVIGGVTVLHDISEAHAMRERMTHLARHDYLTGLPNRALLEDRLSQSLAAVDDGACGAVLFVDLDLFKHINDSLGHPTGDRVLQEVARRLVDAVRPADTVSRQGGDEFMLLVHGIGGAEAARLAEQLIALVERPIEVDGRALHLSASVGIALFPTDSRHMGTLIKQADTALYHAKNAGRGRSALFTAAMGQRADQRLRLETDLRAAIDGGQLFLVYQPKVVLPSRRISGMEALVRWRAPDGRVVPPLEFIPLAEETGLIAAIDGWVLLEACRRHRAWLDAGLPRVPMAVNLSLARIEPARVIARLRDALEATGLPPDQLEVEFTESQMLGQNSLANELVDGIRALGVRLAVDDFGTGYSSLSYLTRYRFDTIKIDRAFIAGLPGDIEHAAVVQAIVGMARTLRCQVVAEGVETDAQAEAVLGLGCEEMQGYRFSHPLDAAEFEPLLRAGVLPMPAGPG